MKFELDTFNRGVTDSELLQDLVTAKTRLTAQGKRLTFRSYRQVGQYSPHTVCARFGSWNGGLRKAGISPSEEKDVGIEALFDNLKLVWIAKGKQPVYRDMNLAPSKYTASIYSDRFGGWRRALEEFVKSVDQEQITIASSERAVRRDTGTKRTKRDPSLALRFMVLKRDRFSCSACGRSPATLPGLILEIDHVLAWSKGGETVAANLQALCFDCNRGKNAS
jgi:5-methylcytosine-specific restriction endonuclease McrA